MSEEIKWKPNPTESVPRHVLQMLVVDPQGRILLLHRSNNVRSARNLWSFPSGLHDIGETAFECAQRELKEEFNLVGTDPVWLGMYENIAPDKDQVEQYHWVITMIGMRVESFNDLVNREPDKHDKVELKNVEGEIRYSDFWKRYPVHPSLSDWFSGDNKTRVIEVLRALARKETKV